jgi:glycosyltransferase 2 family protein
LSAVLKHWRIYALGVLVSAAAIFFVVRQIDIQQLVQALGQANYLYVIPASALIVIGLGARALRWRALLGGTISPLPAFSIINITYLVNGLLPLRLGELARAFLASRGQQGVPVFTSLSSIVLERLLDMLAVLVILGISIGATPLPAEIRAAAAAFTPLLVIGFAVLIFLAAVPERAVRLAGRIIPPALDARFGLTTLFANFLDGLKPLVKPRAAARMLGWTAIAWGLSLASGYVLMFAFFGEGNLAATCLFTAAASFAVAVPAVPGSVGPYEASIVLSLQAMGYTASPETAVAFALVVHGLNLAVVAVLGALGFMQQGISLGQLSQGVRGLRQLDQPAG